MKFFSIYWNKCSFLPDSLFIANLIVLLVLDDLANDVVSLGHLLRREVEDLGKVLHLLRIGGFWVVWLAVSPIDGDICVPFVVGRKAACVTGVCIGSTDPSHRPQRHGGFRRKPRRSFFK